MMLPILLTFPLLAAVPLFSLRSRRAERSVLFLHALLTVGAVLYWAFAGPEEFIGYFRADTGNLLFLALIAAVYLAVIPASYRYLEREKVSELWHRIYVVAMLLFVFSMTGAVLAKNLGLFWVFIEATTLASAPFIYFERHQSSLEATWKYVFICSVGIAIAFIGILFLALSAKGVSDLFYTDLIANAPQLGRFWLLFSFPFLVVGLGTKAGVAPMHSWLPDAHSEAPSPVSAFLSGMLLNTAFYGLYRIFLVMEAAGLRREAAIFFLVCGFASLLIGAVYISGATNYKRLLAYSSIENMGIIFIGVALGGAGLFAAFLHLTAHALTKSSLFITAGNIAHLFGTKEIAGVRGLREADRPTGALWGLGFAAIAGLPPFPIFISEFLIAREMVTQGRFGLLAAFLLLVTLVLYGMARAAFGMYLGSAPAAAKAGPSRPIDRLPEAALLTALLILGVAMPDAVRRIIDLATMSLLP
ncbi:MAG TPA: proton-conducting transporter membrane subunit [bacterium]|nr:proton-conducting transporter membrane subunit [bacterium]